MSPEALPLLHSIVSDKIRRNYTFLTKMILVTEPARLSADCAKRGVVEKATQQPRNALKNEDSEIG
jgi:hypothetical protein